MLCLRPGSGCRTGEDFVVVIGGLPSCAGADSASPLMCHPPTAEPARTGNTLIHMIESFNAIDAVLVLIVLLAAWGGWVRGFVIAGLQLLTLAASGVLAFVGYPSLAALIERNAPSLGGIWAQPLSFLAIFILAQIVFGVAEGRLIRAVPEGVHRNAGNRVLGIAPGFVNGLIHATVASLILLAVPLTDSLSRMARDSELAGRLSAPAEWLEARLTPIFDPAIRRGLQALIVPPESPAVVTLPFKVNQARVRTDLEARMLAMVNAERAEQKLQPLKPDPELAQVARAHSRDMFARGYFSHVTPEQRGPFDRMRAGNVRFLAAGENLALAPTLPRAHQGLMNSPGHRANILRPQFGRVGIGVLDGGRYGLMVTQNFRN